MYLFPKPPILKRWHLDRRATITAIRATRTFMTPRWRDPTRKVSLEHKKQRLALRFRCLDHDYFPLSMKHAVTIAGMQLHFNASH
jgi:hypothetical protein